MSARSTYTPPLEGNMNYNENRRSRSRMRDIDVPIQKRTRLRSFSRDDVPHRAYKKRDTYRRRSRCEHSTSSSSSRTTSSDASLHQDKSNRYLRKRRRNQSKQRGRRYSSSSSSSVSSLAMETGTTGSSSSTVNSDRYSRSQTRYHGKRKRNRGYTTSNKKKSRHSDLSIDRSKNDFCKNFAKYFDKRGSSFEGAHNVLPEFDPDANAQTAVDWIRKVNQTATVYGWSEKQIIYYAIPKLAGNAKKWYQSRSSVNLTWKQWQRKILKTFPDDRNYADRLYEMLDRKSRREESLEEYYHDKARLVKMCGVTGRNAVDCIINGIFDNSIRLNAQGSSFKRPSQLLKYLRRISKKVSGPPRKLGPKTNTHENKTDNTFRDQTAPKPSVDSRSRFKSTRCYNCSELGHVANSCLKPIRRCEKCSRLGHTSQQCQQQGTFRQQETNDKPIQPSDVKKVLNISNSDNTNGKYFKSVLLNGKKWTGYIDFGSQCTLISNKVALASDLILDRTDLPLLRGFGQGHVTPFGRTNVTMEVDAVKADVEVFVVADELLHTDIMVGQSLTELPTVTAYKTSSQLTLYCDNTKAERINVINSSDVNVEGLTDILVHTSDTDYSGYLFIPGNVCLKECKEFNTLQGVYQFENGVGRIIIVNLSGNPLKFSKDKVVSRAIKLPFNDYHKSKVTTFGVNTILPTESSVPSHEVTKDPITLDMLNVGPNVTHDQKLELERLLNSYRDCFAFNMKELGCTTITEMTIRLNDDTPVTYRPYRLPHSERAVVRQIIGELLDNDIIRESQSAYASPIVLVRKKNNDFRLCIDYRALNKKTIKDSYPMPVIEDQLDRLSGKSYFTSLDLSSGYYQIPMSEASRHVTAFVTPDGHYEFTRMPFGLVNAPAVFQNMINKALGNRRFELAVPYLDDLLSAGKSFTEAFEKLREILNLLRQAGLTLNLKKCFFFQSEIGYLGFEISEQGLRPGSKKIQAVSDFPTPTNVHQVRQFVGLASFFRRFIYNFATIAKPLTKLTKADVSWHWGAEQEESFQNIKAKLITRPILALYDPGYETEVHCDASKVGVGGVLLQRPDKDSPFRPVAYFSRQTTQEEQFLHSYELETMAVVLSLQKFRTYLIGIDFTVVTDCNALRSTLTKRDLIPKIARWWLMLQEFSFTIQYRPGHSMQHADALSRNPIACNDNLDEVEVFHISTNNWLHTVQMTDPRLKQIKTILETSSDDLKDITNNYVIRDGKVYRRVGRKLKWVVPQGARWRICQLNHDEAGHFAFEKTLEKISADYWFPKMKRFVKKYVTSCINCAYNKEISGKKSGYLHPIPKVPAIFHTIHMDHLGPFVKSKRGNTHILGVIDGFSKFIFVRAVKNLKSKTTIKVLEEIFATFGCPKIIISDQGTSFTSNEFKSFVESIGVKHILNAVATPRANGQIERYNRTILNSLASMNHDCDEKDWDLNMGKLQWSLNNTINKGIGKTPAEVVFGNRMTSGDENILKGAIELSSPVSEKEREEIRKNVEETISDKQAKMKDLFDRSRAPTKIFEKGDLVMIPNHNPEKGKSKKLAPKFRGPFKITAILDNDRYEVTSIEGHSRKEYKNVYPADQLKRWITFQSSPNKSDNSSSSSDSEA